MGWPACQHGCKWIEVGTSKAFSADLVEKHHPCNTLWTCSEYLCRWNSSWKRRKRWKLHVASVQNGGTADANQTQAWNTTHRHAPCLKSHVVRNRSTEWLPHWGPHQWRCHKALKNDGNNLQTVEKQFYKAPKPMKTGFQIASSWSLPEWLQAQMMSHLTSDRNTWDIIWRWSWS